MPLQQLLARISDREICCAYNHATDEAVLPGDYPEVAPGEVWQGEPRWHDIDQAYGSAPRLFDCSDSRT